MDIKPGWFIFGFCCFFPDQKDKIKIKYRSNIFSSLTKISLEEKSSSHHDFKFFITRKWRETYVWGIDPRKDLQREKVTEADTFLTDDQFLSEVTLLRQNGLLENPKVVELCQRLFSTITDFNKEAWNHTELLRAHLPVVTSVDFDYYNSAITRSVEFNHSDRLVLLLEHLPRILSLATNSTDMLLMFRKANIHCYLIAKEHGFSDSELEKRIILIQRLWRARRAKSEEKVLVEVGYTGPYPEDYEKVRPSLGGEFGRYWGYRHTTYFCRWNRRKRYLILKRLVKEWWGDCRYEGYKDLVEKGDENFLMPRPI